MAEEFTNGYVVMRHPATGAVHEFVAETVDAWKESGWVLDNDPSAEVQVIQTAETTPADTEKEN